MTPAMNASATQDSDAEAITRSVREPQRFAAVFDRYYPQVHALAARRLGQSLADDVASETFLIAFAHRDRYDRSHMDARPWLYGIATNLIARHYRTEQRRYRALARAVVAEVDDGRTDEIDTRVDAQAFRGPLAAALAGMPREDRNVLLLVTWAQLTSEEAGQALGIPAGTVRSRLHRARQRIRAALDNTRTTTDIEKERRHRG